MGLKKIFQEAIGQICPFNIPALGIKAHLLSNLGQGTALVMTVGAIMAAFDGGFSSFLIDRITNGLIAPTDAFLTPQPALIPA
jgi:hypothetical protein